MESIEFPLIQTKTIVPAARPKAIDRPNLVQGVLRQPYFRLLLVCAPAGYGKTTLLADLARSAKQENCEVAWFSIDPADDDPNTFARYLIEALGKKHNELTEILQANQTLRTATGPILRRLAPVFINAFLKLTNPLLIVFDDYHLICNREIHETIQFLVEYAPANLKIAIGSRTRPPLPLGRYRGRSQLLELTAEDLRFNRSEIERFIKISMGLEISAETVLLLESQSEGWAAGLQLAALAMNNSGSDAILPASKQKYLFDYLMSEVFGTLTPDMQEFIVRSSILERMSPSLCDALTSQDTDSRTKLEYLECNNLFVQSLDTEGQWFRFHHLFRRFLHSKLTKEGKASISKLHQKASEWFTINGYFHEGANHAFACEDWEVAAKFVEAHSFNLILHSELSLLRELCAKFPEEIIEHHPRLCISQCWGWVFSFQRKYRKKILQRLDQAKDFSQKQTCDENLRNELNESSKIIRQLMALAPDPEMDISKTLIQGKELLSGYKEDDPSRFSMLLSLGYINMALNNIIEARANLESARKVAFEAGLYFGVVESSFHLARVAHMEGRLDDALAISDQTIHSMQNLPDLSTRSLPGIGCLDISAGCVLYEKGLLDDAEKRIRNGLNLVGPGMNPFYLVVGYTTLCNISQIKGRSSEIESCLMNLEMIWPDIDFLVQGLKLIYRPQSNGKIPSEASHWISEFRSTMMLFKNLPGFGPFAGREIYYQAALIWLRLNHFQGNDEEILPSLESFYHEAHEKGLFHRALELMNLRLAIFGENVSDDKIWKEFENLVGYARENGYSNIFGNYPETLPFLIRAEDKGIFPLYLNTIIDEMKDRLKKQADSIELNENQDIFEEFQISARELEILSHLERGDSNQTIAQALFITTGTVKSHVNHILTKLGAANRTQAVSIARELGLFRKKKY